MTTRYYEETVCEHGEMEYHYTCDDIEYPRYRQMEHTNETCFCPGGQRRELTGVEVESPLLSGNWPTLSAPGRYLVIPLEEPE